MGITGQTLIGVNSIGEHDGAGTDTDWGRTQESGASLQLAVTKQTLMGGQSKMAEDVHISAVEMSVQFNALFSELEKLQLMLGIAASQFTGDLSAGTPTAEELAIDQDSIGGVEKGIFVEGPGPSSTRRLEAERALLGDVGDLQWSDTEWQLPQVNWDILNTADGTDVLTITDAT